MKIELLENIKVNPCGKVFCKPDWQWDCGPGKTISDLDLWVIVSGKGTLLTKEQTYELGMGDCFILNGQTPFYGVTDEEFPLVVIYIHFDICDNSGNSILPLDSDVGFDFYRNMSNFHFFVQLLERVLMLKFNKRFTEAAYWLKAALLEIAHQDEQLSLSVNNSSVASFMQELCKKIRSHPEQRFSLSKEAGKIFYSPDYFARLFKEYTSSSFRDYILQSRIDAASLYLDATSYNISRIAEILGYNDIYLFSRQFKQQTGMSPTDYRKYQSEKSSNSGQLNKRTDIIP